MIVILVLDPSAVVGHELRNNWHTIVSEICVESINEIAAPKRIGQSSGVGNAVVRSPSDKNRPGGRLREKERIIVRIVRRDAGGSRSVDEQVRRVDPVDGFVEADADRV